MQVLQYEKRLRFLAEGNLIEASRVITGTGGNVRIEFFLISKYDVPRIEPPPPLPLPCWWCVIMSRGH